MERLEEYVMPYALFIGENVMFVSELMLLVFRGTYAKLGLILSDAFEKH